MYNTTKEFLADWENEAKLTTKVIKCITPEALKEAPNDINWNLGRIAYHLSETFTETISKAIQADVTLKYSKEEALTSVEKLVEVYKDGSQNFAKNIQANIGDENLKDVVNIFGMSITKEQILDLTIRHQIHHRGQMTVLLRQAGLSIPGVYGPNKEEWEAMGLPNRD